MDGAMTRYRPESARRIEYTAQLMGSGLPEYAVIDKLKLDFGISFRQCVRYMSRARGIMIAWTQQPKAAHFTESATFYRTIIQTSKDERNRIAARERLDSLYGLDAKYDDKDDGASVVNNVLNITVNNLSAEQLAVLYDLRKRLAGVGDGADGDEGRGPLPVPSP